MWQPFDARFANFIKRLEFHDKVIKFELDILHLKTSQITAKAQAEERCDQQLFRTEVQHYFNLIKDMCQGYSTTQKRRDRMRSFMMRPLLMKMSHRTSSRSNTHLDRPPLLRGTIRASIQCTPGRNGRVAIRYDCVSTMEMRSIARAYTTRLLGKRSDITSLYVFFELNLFRQSWYRKDSPGGIISA